MALSYKNVERAKEILQQITGMNAPYFNERTEDNQYRTDFILGIDEKEDGGWENIFINIENITKEQLEIFNIRKTEIRNSSFIHEVQKNITRIGWY